MISELKTSSHYTGDISLQNDTYKRTNMHITLLLYVSGTMSILWYVIWEIFVYESPAVHPTISENERNYIERSIADSKIEVIACLMTTSTI